MDSLAEEMYMLAAHDLPGTDQQPFKHHPQGAPL